MTVNQPSPPLDCQSDRVSPEAQDSGEVATGSTTDAGDRSNTNGNNGADEINAWQDRLLGLMMYVLLGITSFFFLVTLVVLIYVQISVQNVTGADPQLLLQSDLDPTTGQLYLNACSINQRYHQGRALVMSRIWVQYMSFITGMALCMVGATFVLGKLRSSTEAQLSRLDLKVMFKANSPGIVLACLGSLVICVSLLADRPITIGEAISPITVPAADSTNGDMSRSEFEQLLKGLLGGAEIDSSEKSRLEQKFGKDKSK
ncbi:MAG: hypothetical protein H8E44_22900 [Planctomycetes bacterium]|nr:hypothetical protein [Planctomycetota bacterium]